jgi:peptidoglycan LD-endopeptidase CwlK
MIKLSLAKSITKHSIATLKPDFADRVRQWHLACEQAGLPYLYIYEGYRSMARQQELYEKRPRVTKAKPGQSYHNYARAIDYVPLKPVDKVLDTYEADWDNDYIYTQAQEIAKQFNLQALSWEMPHLQDGNFKNWQELAEKEPVTL